MADVENGDVLRIGGTWEYDGTEEVTNVFHVLVKGGGEKTLAQVTDDIEEYMDLMFDNLDTFLSDKMLVDRLSLANVTQHLVFGALNWGTMAQGGAASEETASGVSLLCYGRTYLPRVQIRKYYGVFTEPAMVDGQWSTTLRAAATTDFNSHINDQVMTDGLELTGVAWNRLLETYTEAVSSVTVAEPCYQRRRRRGRGS